MARKDRNNDSILIYLLKKEFSQKWDSYTNNTNINLVLSKSSKNGSGNVGFPDQIYVNESEKLLIIVEDKPKITQHISIDGFSKPCDYAVDGVVWYLSKFLENNLKKIGDNLIFYFKQWKIIGVAISGDIDDDYNHLLSTFILHDDNIEEKNNVNDILNEEEYINLFENYDEERIISNISSSSKNINKKLRSVDSQKRPILLSALMICLFKIKNGGNSFINEYCSNTPEEIVSKIQDRVDAVLKSENIPDEKRRVLRAELEFINVDHDLNNSDVIKDILDELKSNVIPLFERKTNYDIIGKFYEEFLRYAGVSNVKKGIVLTPNHITTLFTDLIDFKTNDVIFDACCGTGTFLIAGMNKLISTINNSDIANKTQAIRKIKQHQLIGFEKNPTMYTLAISNMLFRGDGKSQIFNVDFFSEKADEELETLKSFKADNGTIQPIIPTIGFINPPYGGKDNKDNPTKKEIQFLSKLLDICTRYGIIIAPLSTYFKDDNIRNSILKKHTLKYVINMPNDLFMPNAATNTAIAVFATNIPHGNNEVVFYDLKDDGLVLNKSKGRTDVLNKWPKIKSELLEKINNPEKYADGITLLKTKIKKNDEWLIQAHSLTDYTLLNNNCFIKAIKEYYILNFKMNNMKFNADIDLISFMEILSKTHGNDFIEQYTSEFALKNINTDNWYNFSIESKELFSISRGVRLTKEDRIPGNTPLITAGYLNQGIAENIENEEMERYKNAITIDMFCNSFYRDYEFCCDDNIIVLSPNFNINRYIALFIITVINLDKYKFSYGRQYRLKHVQKHKIKLPYIIVNGEPYPDFGKMEEIIKSMPYSSKIK